MKKKKFNPLLRFLGCLSNINIAKSIPSFYRNWILPSFVWNLLYLCARRKVTKQDAFSYIFVHNLDGFSGLNIFPLLTQENVEVVYSWLRSTN